MPIDLDSLVASRFACVNRAQSVGFLPATSSLNAPRVMIFHPVSSARSARVAHLDDCAAAASSTAAVTDPPPSIRNADTARILRCLRAPLILRSVAVRSSCAASRIASVIRVS